MKRLPEIVSQDSNRLTSTVLVPHIYAICMLTISKEHTMMAWQNKLASILIMHRDYPSSEDLKVWVIVLAIPQGMW